MSADTISCSIILLVSFVTIGRKKKRREKGLAALKNIMLVFAYSILIGEYTLLARSTLLSTTPSIGNGILVVFSLLLL
ncbi:hypothetical protein EDC94DRAFT_597327 [Helicostylum pulchrum]|nr:hypothetical protein EDC94DRAFT_597327 [Helicostylum pulchrum]